MPNNRNISCRGIYSGTDFPRSEGQETLNQLSKGIAPDIDEIPTELFKATEETDKVLRVLLHVLNNTMRLRDWKI